MASVETKQKAAKSTEEGTASPVVVPGNSSGNDNGRAGAAAEAVAAFPAGEPRDRKARGQRVLANALVRLAGRIERMPRKKALRWGTALGRMAYRAAKRQRRYADRNLRLVFGDAMSARERAELTRRVFESFAKSAIDFLRGPAIDAAELSRLVSAVEGWEEHAKPAYERGKGFVMVTAHLGNWELLGRWLAAQGISLTAVGRDPEDPVFSEYVRRMRQGAGITVAGKGGSVKPLLLALKRGEMLGLLPDQNSGDLFVPFFGVPAGTVAGPATLAMRTGAVMVPIFCVRLPDDTYKIIALPEIPVEDTGNREEDLRRIMTEVNRILESMIRQYPDQWLWLHNRWKSAFEEKNRARWPAGYSYDEMSARWNA